MTDIILHHYETSPYSEKVRLGFGLKGLAWQSVEIPAIMPKPDLTALTGGYRKTPVLQIGADIYCDSQLIMCELERRHPTPSFYPVGRGAADALSWWAEKTMFNPAAGIVFAKKRDAIPAAAIRGGKWRTLTSLQRRIRRFHEQTDLQRHGDDQRRDGGID